MVAATATGTTACQREAPDRRIAIEIDTSHRARAAIPGVVAVRLAGRSFADDESVLRPFIGDECRIGPHGHTGSYCVFFNRKHRIRGVGSCGGVDRVAVKKVGIGACGGKRPLGRSRRKAGIFVVAGHGVDVPVRVRNLFHIDAARHVNGLRHGVRIHTNIKHVCDAVGNNAIMTSGIRRPHDRDRVARRKSRAAGRTASD